MMALGFMRYMHQYIKAASHPVTVVAVAQHQEDITAVK